MGTTHALDIIVKRAGGPLNCPGSMRLAVQATDHDNRSL